ncbi:hypothetical protein QK342_12340 [Myroides odoratimimus]|uniref:hypothetical protein n=1 Tax=Myroides odoratimimus TaxID=76832 RepID=UPI0024BF6CE6|nr:hypothetical protein [Myroides odoratimimus]MDM1459543.1 hypothetical protein [Myroides odoratimimus]WHT72493.1 hypothetical protein QK342_12340 [Myroides odoratimimus]WHU37076.1 hypothetical protein QNM93_12330 [Myroides odoratimimus]
MKKILFFISCVALSAQVQAQESVVLSLDLQPGSSYEITSNDKFSTITNLVGNKEIIEMINKEGQNSYPTYETEESNASYTLHWTTKKKNSLNFDLDLEKRVARVFEGKSVVNTETEGPIKGYSRGSVDAKKGLKLSKSLGEKHKTLEGDLIVMLDDLFNGNGLSSDPIKVNQEFESTNTQKMRLSDESEVEVTTKEVNKIAKIANNKAYLVIETTITSKSTSTKFAEMKGGGTKEVIYDMEKKYFESIDGKLDVTVNIESDEGVNITMVNTTSQNVKVKKK